jgi:hypothetical protein
MFVCVASIVYFLYQIIEKLLLLHPPYPKTNTVCKLSHSGLYRRKPQEKRHSILRSGVHMAPFRGGNGEN